MKKILYLFIVLIAFAMGSHAQEEESGNGGKVKERMKEFIQKKLNLSGSEADKFSPVFLNYLNDLKRTNQQYKGDKLVQQQKVADLRLQYRDQFKDIIGEKRGNDVFNYEREFRNQLIIELKERQNQQLENRTNKRAGG